MIIVPSCGEHVQSTNGTGAQSIRLRERQQYQYGSSKQAKPQPMRGPKGSWDELRKNLTSENTILDQRQGDDPDQNSVHLRPMEELKNVLSKNEVSTNRHINIRPFVILDVNDDSCR